MRQKVHRLLMIYDDELRNPSNVISATRVRKIEDHDYDAKLAGADCDADIAHLVPQVSTGNAHVVSSITTSL